MNKRKRIIIIIVSIVLLLGLCMGVIKQLKIHNDNNRDINYGDIGGGILLNSADINFSNGDLASKNVENAIGEIYDAVEDGCLAGYERGAETGGIYVCNKKTSDAEQTQFFASSSVKYNNNYSGLESINVNDAIVEIAGLVPDCKIRYTKQNVTSNSYECKKTIKVTAFAQSVGEGDPIAQGPGLVMVSGLATGDHLSSVTLTQSTTSLTDNGTITPSNAVILDSNDNDVTSTYTITYVNGLLVVNSYETCLPPTDVTISSTGVVTWTASNTALAYEISFNGTTYSASLSGMNYNSTLLAAAGTRTVYVRSVCDDSIYNTPSINASASVNVYSVTLTKGAGISAVTGAGKYYEGTTVTLGATVATGYNWSKWTQTNSIITVSTTNAYSAAITSNWEFNAIATAKTYTVNYYNGNGTSTTGSTLLGSSTCTFGTTCTLKTYASQLGGVFPYSSNDPNHDNYSWTFYGWTTNATGTSRTYADGAGINPTTYSSTITLYSLGRKYYRFSSGIAPTGYLSTQYQYWNPRNTGSSFRTSISIPAATSLSSSSNGSWTFIGYTNGGSSGNTDVHFAANLAGTTYNPAVTDGGSGLMRSKYTRTLSISYNKNGGSGSTMDPSTKTQIYNSGYGNAEGTTNTGSSLGANGIKLKSNTYTKPTGWYAFKGWRTSATGGTKYDAGETYSGLGSTIKSTNLSLTLYAYWKDCCDGYVNISAWSGEYCYRYPVSDSSAACHYIFNHQCYQTRFEDKC